MVRTFAPSDSQSEALRIAHILIGATPVRFNPPV